MGTRTDARTDVRTNRKLNALDRFALAVSPKWGQNRVRARMVADTLARHYEAASVGRRTANWRRSSGDANAAVGSSLAVLREHGRDLVRNNGWARNAIRVISDNTVGWGIVPKAIGDKDGVAAALWKSWAESTQCDADGRLNFYGLEKLAMRTIVESGEVLIRRRYRRISDGLAIPMQLQMLEPDLIDTGKNSATSLAGGPIVLGVEFDLLGKRAAYWLFEQHPGSELIRSSVSKRVPAADVNHVFLPERPGQTRAPSWLSAAVLNLKDFDEFEDAELVRQKIAACFAGFVTDVDGTGAPLGSADDSGPDPVETIEPGMMSYLKPGQEVSFATPPVTVDGGFSVRTLRRIAVTLGVSYEDLTGDYSMVNFSSARMGRIKHWGHVHGWRWDMLIPQFCAVSWDWAMEVATIAGSLRAPVAAEWTPPPMPMLEPDREGLALQRLVRAGAMTVDEMVRERGFDPDTHWAEYAAGLARLDALGIWLDSDVRRTSQAGLTQARAGLGSGSKDDEKDDAGADADRRFSRR